MANKCYDVDYLLEILYDRLYNKASNRIFINNYEKLGRLDVSNVKYTFTRDDTLQRYNLIIQNIFSKQHLVFEFENNNKLFFRRKNSYIVFGNYSNDNQNNSLTESNNIGKLTALLLSEIVLVKDVDFVLLPVLNMDINKHDMEKIINDHNLKRMDKLTKNNEIVSMEIRERFFDYVSLDELFQNKKYRTDFYMKLFVFLIVYYLCLIQSYYPNYRHNKLDCTNILVFKKHLSNPYINFLYGNTDFRVPNIDYYLKITGFEYSYEPIKIQNSQLPEELKMNNKYYDIYYFLTDLLNQYDFKEAPEFIKFTKMIIPKQIYMIDLNPGDVDEIMTPEEILLNNQYFAEFKQFKMKRSKRIPVSETNENEDEIEEETEFQEKNFVKLPEDNEIYQNYDLAYDEYGNYEGLDMQTGGTKVNKKFVEQLFENKYFVDYLNNYMRPTQQQRMPTYIPAQQQYPQSYQQTFQVTPEEMSYMYPQQQRMQEIGNVMNQYKGGLFMKNPLADTQEKPKMPDQQNSLFEFKMNMPKVKQKVELPQYYPFVPYYGMPPNQQMAFVPGVSGNVDLQAWTGMPNPVKPPKAVTINIGNLGDPSIHEHMYHIYEDILPPSAKGYTLNSLQERLGLMEYLRSIFVKQGDGEDIKMSGTLTQKNDFRINLLSYIKIMEFNPYFIGKLSNNPYSNMSEKMLIYRTGYPVRIDSSREDTNRVIVVPESIRINLRIYEMSKGEEAIMRIEDNNYDKYDLWREVMIYEFIREEIIKKMVSPNFVMMYCYYITTDLDINFDKIRNLKKAYGQLDMAKKPLEKEEISKKINELRSYLKNVLQKDVDNLNKDDTNLVLNKIEELDKTSSKNLIALTESPDVNILKWASRIYNEKVNKRSMIETGFYSEKVWKNIIFQIITIFNVMYRNKIAYVNMSLGENIFIKNLAKTKTVPTGYWIYSIEGINYYIKNYGYLVQFDSNYKEVNLDNYSLKDKKKIHKIYSKQFKEPDQSISDIVLFKIILKNMAKVLNPNNFSNDFVNNGGIKPPQPIINLLQNINDDIMKNKKFQIEYYLLKYFREYLHNRIGSIVSKNELEYKMNDNNIEFNKGDLVMFNYNDNHYMWAMFIEKESDKARILCKTNVNNMEIEEQVVNAGLIYKFEGRLKQRYQNIENKFDENDLIETYRM